MIVSISDIRHVQYAHMSVIPHSKNPPPHTTRLTQFQDIFRLAIVKRVYMRIALTSYIMTQFHCSLKLLTSFTQDDDGCSN